MKGDPTEKESRLLVTGGGAISDAGGAAFSRPNDTTHKPNAQDLLQALWRDAPGWRYLWALDTQRSTWLAPNEGIPTQNGAQDLFFGVNTCQATTKPPPNSRAKAANVAALVALYADLDAGGYDPTLRGTPHDTRTAETRARGMALALRHLDTLQPRPSATVNTGGGWHAYWLLEQPWLLDSDEARTQAAALVKRWAAFVGGDPAAADLARILRLPGTVNGKYPDRPPVTLAEWHPDLRYSVQALLDVLPPTEAPRKVPSTTAPTLQPDEVEHARAALAQLAPWRCDEYAPWLDVGMALHWLGDPGLELWENWSRGSTHWREGACAQKWDTLTDKPEGVTLRSLYYWATRDSGGSAPDSTPTQGDEQPPAREHYHCTDAGNADRFCAQWRGSVLWSAQLGWLVWDGKRWAPDEAARAVGMAKATARELYQEAYSEPDETKRKDLSRWAAASENAARIQGMLTLAQPDLAINVDALDADPWLLNCNNGTLDLRTGELRDHDPRDLITKLAPTAYDPDARSSALEIYLRDATQGDEGLRAYLQRAAGYSLTGSTAEEAFFLLLGPAATGKTTLVESLLAVLGDYATKASFDTFLERRDVGAPRPDLAALRGARLVAAVETAASRRLAAPIVKELTGGDTITARHLYARQFSFVPTCKLWLAANEAPRMSDRDSGLWRRLRRVPFVHVIEKPDPVIKSRLRDPGADGKALLAWAVRGCMAWQREGLGGCAQVAKASAELRASMDPVAEFYEARCTFGAGKETPVSALRTAYENWARENGATDREMVAAKEWGDRLRERGCERRQRRVGGAVTSFWEGVGLQDVPGAQV